MLIIFWIGLDAGPKGEAGGRKRRTVNGWPDRWNEQPMGLARVAIEARCQRAKSLLLGGSSVKSPARTANASEAL